LPPLERALALRAATAGDPVDRAEVEFFVAQALVASGGDRRRGHALAASARAACAAAGAGARAELAAVDTWLAAEHKSEVSPRRASR
jgi:hypothetical protein